MMWVVPFVLCRSLPGSESPSWWAFIYEGGDCDGFER